MKNLIITEKQINEIIQQLQEVPAKFVFNAIKTLITLPEVPMAEKEKDEG